MKYFFTGILSIFVMTSCAPRYASWPLLIKNSGPSELDPNTASFEDHIFTLSVLKSAIPASQEYRDRLREGYRHPKTWARSDEEFVHIPEKATDQFNPFAHAYLLNRSGRKFTLYCYGGETPFPRHEYFRDERGWWLEDPWPKIKSSTK